MLFCINVSMAEWWTVCTGTGLEDKETTEEKITDQIFHFSHISMVPNLQSVKSSLWASSELWIWVRPLSQPSINYWQTCLTLLCSVQRHCGMFCSFCREKTHGGQSPAVWRSDRVILYGLRLKRAEFTCSYWLSFNYENDNYCKLHSKQLVHYLWII